MHGDQESFLRWEDAHAKASLTEAEVRHLAAQGLVPDASLCEDAAALRAHASRMLSVMLDEMTLRATSAWLMQVAAVSDLRLVALRRT